MKTKIIRLVSILMCILFFLPFYHFTIFGFSPVGVANGQYKDVLMIDGNLWFFLMLALPALAAFVSYREPLHRFEGAAAILASIFYGAANVELQTWLVTETQERFIIEPSFGTYLAWIFSAILVITVLVDGIFRLARRLSDAKDHRGASFSDSDTASGRVRFREIE
jgi:hypothetical protein